ncbi:MAG: VanZ family protein [Mycoplasmatota bacterium]|nr:VanZ family protein [Mycoplasmatota bacterium]
MLGRLTSTIQGVVNFTWPTVIISVVVLVSFRICYLVKNRQKLILYKELLGLSFVIYALCLFQVVTFQDNVTWATNNFIPFREMLRYNIGSHLFVKNVLGNMLMFLPYGFFVSFYLKNKKPWLTLILTVIASFSIELVQMVIGRVFDIDDILLNLLGGYLGYLVYYWLSKLYDKIPETLKSEKSLNIVAAIILIGIITIL